MKKTALALGSAFMLFANTVDAQEQPWSFGVKAGGSMSWLHGSKKACLAKGEICDREVDFEYKTSGRLAFAGGLTAGYAFNEKIGVGLEVLYSGLGGKITQTKKLSNGATDAEKKANKSTIYRIYTDNIAIPVMFKWFPMGYDPEKGIFTVDLGVQGTMALRTKVEQKDESKDNAKFEEMKGTGSKELDKKKIGNPFTLDAIAGVSYEFPGIGLTLEGRYHFGFMNLLKGGDDAKNYRNETLKMEKDATLRNHYLTLSLGYNLARLLL